LTEGIHVGFHHIVSECGGVEIAIDAAALAKGNMNVKAGH
jgi:hypothetical protein